MLCTRLMIQYRRPALPPPHPLDHLQRQPVRLERLHQLLHAAPCLHGDLQGGEGRDVVKAIRPTLISSPPRLLMPLPPSAPNASPPLGS